MFQTHYLKQFSLAVILLFSLPLINQAQKSGRHAAKIATKRTPSRDSSVSAAKKKELDEARKLKEKALQLAYLKKYDEAIRYADRSLVLKKSALGAEHPDVSEDMILFGAIYEEDGKLERAESLYKQALAIGEKTFGADDAYNDLALENLASLYRKREDYERAEMFYARLLKMREKSSGTQSPEVSQALESLIAIYIAKSEYEKAEPLKLRAFANREKQFGAESIEFAKYLLELANLYINKKEFRRAEPLYNRALNIYEKNLGATHPDVVNLKNAWRALKKQM